MDGINHQNMGGLWHCFTNIAVIYIYIHIVLISITHFWWWNMVKSQTWLVTKSKNTKTMDQFGWLINLARWSILERNPNYVLSPSLCIYPLVNIQKTMDNHHVQWVNQRTKWPFSTTNCQSLPEGKHPFYTESSCLCQLSYLEGRLFLY